MFLKVQSLGARTFSSLKEWLWLTFFPQEDAAKLTVLKNNLTTFLKAVTKALSLELEALNISRDILKNQRKAVVDEIFRNLPAINSTLSFHTNTGQQSKTLEFEFDQLAGMNLQ